jgi:hypothetical protein
MPSLSPEPFPDFSFLPDFVPSSCAVKSRSNCVVVLSCEAISVCISFFAPSSVRSDLDFRRAFALAGSVLYI